MHNNEPTKIIVGKTSTWKGVITHIRVQDFGLVQKV
jgi:hypothetical protein